jgi:integrase
MAKVRFNLKEAGKKGECSIFLVLENNNQKLKYSIGLSIKRQFWDTTSQRAKRSNSIPYSEFNQRLQYLETETERILLRLQNENGVFPSIDTIKKELDILTKKNQVIPISLLEFLENRVQELKKERTTNSTSKQYGTVLTILKEYKAYKKRRYFDYLDITDAFLNDFQTFAYQVKEYNPNTLWKYISILKTAMSEAQNKGYHNNEIYKKFSIKKVPTHEIYLNETELEKIYKLDLSDKAKGYEVVRDLFIVGCFTGGLRFSDWAKIRPEQITGDVCSVITQKTGQSVTFPITQRYVKDILVKYDNNLPKPLSNQKTNELIKEVGKLAGIDTKTVKVEYPSGIRLETTVSKYELITTHTARRSFATNLIKRGVPLHTIRLLTGHSSERQLNQYLKIDSSENAMTVANKDFFN